MLELVDPPIPATEHLPISEDLQKALGDIQCRAEERLEVLKGQKRILETGMKEDMKLVLGHIEKVEEEEVTEMKRKETETGDTDPPRKHRVTQSVTALKEARQKQMMADQERRWLELTGGQYGPRPRPKASASLGAPVGSATVTSITSTATATVSSTAEAGEEVDLEEAMHSQGDEEESGYGKKYKTTSEDRTDRNAARAKQKEERERQEKNVRQWNMRNRRSRVRLLKNRNSYRNKLCLNKRKRRWRKEGKKMKNARDNWKKRTRSVYRERPLNSRNKES